MKDENGMQIACGFAAFLLSFLPSATQRRRGHTIGTIRLRAFVEEMIG